MKVSSTGVGAAVTLLAVAMMSGASAQTVLRGSSITERNLIEALTPAPADVRTRSIRVERDKSDSGAELKKASASLLITFETDSAALTPAAQASLDVVARALQADRLASFNFSIEGHADPRGPAEHNMALSQSRAESVVDYLVGRHSIVRERLRPIGKGETELANPARPAAPENRRVTITTLSQ